MLKQSMTWLAMAVVAVITTQAQQGRWAPADDATAKFILDSERQWQEANCDHNKITEKILADDFWGTLPDGTDYGKAEEVKETKDPSKSGRECRISVKIRVNTHTCGSHAVVPTVALGHAWLIA